MLNFLFSDGPKKPDGIENSKEAAPYKGAPAFSCLPPSKKVLGSQRRKLVSKCAFIF